MDQPLKSKARLAFERDLDMRYGFYLGKGLTREQAAIVAKTYSKHQRHKLFLLYTQKHCQHCGTTDNLTIDHIIPVSVTKKQRQMDLANKQLLCKECNHKKGCQMPS